MDAVSGETIVFVLLGTFAAYFVYSMIRYRGFKGALFGAKIVSPIGEVSCARSKFVSKKIKVHLLESDDPADGRVGIELTSSAPGSWHTVPFTLSDSAVQELISLLAQTQDQSSRRPEFVKH